MKPSNPGNKKRFVLLTVLVSFLLNVVVLATEMEVRPGITGIWLQPEEKEDPNFNWNSQWIWMDESTNSDVMLARRTFDLSENPKEQQFNFARDYLVITTSIAKVNDKMSDYALVMENCIMLGMEGPTGEMVAKARASFRSGL